MAAGEAQKSAEKRQECTFQLDVGGDSVRIYTQKIQGSDVSLKPIVLLHEGLGSCRLWRGFPEQLSEVTGRSVYIYDRQGYGFSSPFSANRKPDYLHRYALDELPSLLRAMNLESPILFGHSDGGSIALLYASQHKVDAYVSLAAHVFVEEITLQGIREAGQAWQSTNWPEKLSRYHGDKTNDVFNAWHDTWLKDPFPEWNIEAELDGVQAPGLIVQGIDDEYGSPEQVHAIVKGVTGPAEPLLIEDCGHAPHLEQTDVVLKATAAFLKDMS